jgi:TolB-like protein
MTEALISSLAQISALRVISRTSVMSFKGTQKPLPPLPEIARELKVDGVIEGSVQRENGRVKVMIQLIHGPSDTHLWAREYERAMTDVLKLQGEMARAIANEIRIQVTPEERTRWLRPPPSIRRLMKRTCSGVIISGSTSSTTISGP